MFRTASRSNVGAALSRRANKLLAARGLRAAVMDPMNLARERAFDMEG